MLQLKLSKLSWTQDVPVNSVNHSTQWQSTQQDLTFLLEDAASQSDWRKVLRIRDARQERYAIPIEELIMAGRSMMQQLRNTGLAASSDLLPISAIGKSPMLAIRYVLPDRSQVRRLQMRFASASDYNLVLHQMRNLGLCVLPPKSVTSAPSSAASQGAMPNQGPSCPPSQLAELDSRPYTASSVPSFDTQSREAAKLRPASAVATSSDPLVPPVYFPRPHSNPALSVRERSVSHEEVAPRSASPSTRPSSGTLSTDPGPGGLPPRRELPFSRPGSAQSAGSESARPFSRSGTMGPPPLPPPSRDGFSRAFGRSGSMTPIDDLPPLPKPTLVGNNAAAVSETSFPNNGKSLRRPSSATFSGGLTSSLPVLKSSERPATSDGGPTKLTPAKRRALSSISSNVQNKRIPSIASSEVVGPAAKVVPDRGDEASASSLQRYADQCDEARSAALDDFILSILDDDNFLTLVEDMEVCWARLAPGLG